MIKKTIEIDCFLVEIGSCLEVFEFSAEKKDEKMSGTSKVGANGGGDELIPIQSLTESGWSHRPRVQRAVIHFQERFGTPPNFYVRVPGRVNLIGEHIDYCGYGVFPMAIEQDVFVSARVFPTEGITPLIRLTNVDSKYNDFETPLDKIRLLLAERKSSDPPAWHLYFFCGVQGILEHFQIPGVSFEVCVDGILPPSAGLSSSSALVCAAALITLIANTLTMTKKQMASLCAKSERYIGTEGGGMDQAIAFLATAGTAQMIEFVPELNGEKVVLPSKAVFVIANSLADSNKGDSTSGYNVRVAECRLATWILAKDKGLKYFEYTKVNDLQLAIKASFGDMLELIKKNLRQDEYNLDQIADILEINVDELEKIPLISKILALNRNKLKLQQRVRHVIEEAQRVHEFRRICLEDGESPDALQKLGQLMSGSHRSLRELYECSHPKLDQLVQLSDGITYGARLTGAGWGGCMVALVDQSQLLNYLETLKTQFYQTDHSMGSVFVTQPGDGAIRFTA